MHLWEEKSLSERLQGVPQQDNFSSITQQHDNTKVNPHVEHILALEQQVNGVNSIHNNTLTVCLKVHKASERSKPSTVVVQRIADTGASVVCCGPRLMKQLNLSSKNLNRGNSVLKSADNRELSVIGTIPVNFQFNGASYYTNTVKTLHVVQGLD